MISCFRSAYCMTEETVTETWLLNDLLNTHRKDFSLFLMRLTLDYSLHEVFTIFSSLPARGNKTWKYNDHMILQPVLI